MSLYIQPDRELTPEERLFANNLPLREELIDELTRWREQVEQGLTFSQQCDLLMQKVLCLADHAADHTRVVEPPGR